MEALVSSTIQSNQVSREPLKLLVETGLLLARERNLDVIVQSALDAGRELCKAEWGAFFYTGLAAEGALCPMFKLSGLYADHPEHFPLAEVDHRLTETLFGGGILRCADISSDVHFGPGTAFAPLTQGEHPTRSYFAIPVHSAAGELLGGLLYSHPDSNVFRPHTEPFIEAIAAQAAIAIENTRLHEHLTKEATVASRAHQLQREKTATESRLRQALDAAQLGTWSWNRATDMLDLDERAAELFHVPAHIPISRSFLRNSVVVEEDRSITTSNLDQALKQGALYHAEYRVLSPDGTPGWLSASGLATFPENSAEPIGMTGTVQDITLRKTQENALRQSEKLAATGRLAATIAHEINNPLEAVTNLIYLVKTDPSVPETAQHLLETADQELARVAQIAQQTLGFYRDTTRPVDIDLANLLRGVMGLFERKLTYKRMEYKLDLAENLHIFGLQGELRQVFSNLIVNAIDASHRGRVIIRARHRTLNGKPGVSVLISDEGSGIPPAIRDRLFAPFFTTKVDVGTGLGLWVTKGIVEKQGGSISFRSSVGNPSGTIFRVFLRASMPAAQHDLQVQNPPLSTSESKLIQ